MEFNLDLLKYAPLVGAYRSSSTNSLEFTTNVNTLRFNLRTYVINSKSRVDYS